MRCVKKIYTAIDTRIFSQPLSQESSAKTSHFDSFSFFMTQTQSAKSCGNSCEHYGRNSPHKMLSYGRFLRITYYCPRYITSNYHFYTFDNQYITNKNFIFQKKKEVK